MGNEPVSVQPQVFALLVFLIENRGRVVTKDEVIESVWDGRIVSDSTLNARINALRRALGDDGKSQSIIRTLPRRGFRFVADISCTDEAESLAGSLPAEAQAPALLNDRRSIAVLPFKNFSGDVDQEYFADGMTEDLITDLSKIPELFVIARNSSFAYKQTTTDIRKIGLDLGVSHVLEGSIRKMGSQVRINAQLVDANTGGHLWAERYDADFAEIFSLQDEIAAKIVSALEVNLTLERAPVRNTASVAAYELSLRGRSKFFMFSPETNAESIRLFEQAVEIDPEFSDAWAGQVFPYQSGWSFIWPGYDDGLEIAAIKAEKAVALAPNSSLAQSRLGWVQVFLPEPEKSVASFERALKLDPHNTDALAFFPEVLNFAGDPARAVGVGEIALKFDPVPPPNVTFHIGHAHFLLGDLENAEKWIGRAIEMAPTFPVARLLMAATLVELGKEESAKSQINALRKMHPQHNISTFNLRYPYHDNEHRSRVLAGLRTAGLPEGS